MTITCIMKITDDCNLNCKYCYDHNIRSRKKEMSFDILEKSIDEIASLVDKKVTLIWHGGEPLLREKNFFEKVVELQEKYDIEFKNNVQTNATILSDEYLEFFKKNNFELSISVDGPRFLNNKTRMFENGEGCFEEIKNNLNKLKNFEFTDIGGILILNKYNISHLSKIYEFAMNHHLSLKVNPLTPIGDIEKNLELFIEPKDYGKALTKLFDIWYYDEDSELRTIDTLEKYLRMLVSNEPVECRFNKTCQQNFFAINTQGDVLPCSRFDGEEKFVFGNIMENHLDNILNDELRNELSKRFLRLPDKCKECKYFEICHGGCMHDSFSAYQDVFKEDPYCEANKMIYNHISECISEEVSDYGG